MYRTIRTVGPYSQQYTVERSRFVVERCMPQLAKPMGECTVTGWGDIDITMGSKQEKREGVL